MKIDTITNTYKDHNEDIYGTTKNCFWILDGALPLSKAKYSNESSDVVWMVNWWNKYLLHNIEQMDKSIVRILEEGIDQLNMDFGQFTDINNLSKLDRASATIAIVRINGLTVENYVLGDTEINIQYENGSIDTLIDEKIEDLDNQVINMIFNNSERRNNITFNGYTDEELKILRDNRMKMNSIDGYYILEHDKKAIKNGIYKEYELSKIREILLMSDGYSAIYNKYKELTQHKLMEICKHKGTKEVLNTIRQLEENDYELKTHKRLRLHDDATAIYINL